MKKYELICREDIEHTDGTELGPHLVLHKAWDSLELDVFFGERGFSRDSIATAKVSIFNHLPEPVSENELPARAGTTALGDLLGIHPGH